MSLKGISAGVWPRTFGAARTAPELSRRRAGLAGSSGLPGGESLPIGAVTLPRRVPAHPRFRRRAAAAILVAAALLPSPVSSAIISTWDPSAAGILNRFGTVALSPGLVTIDFQPGPGAGFSAPFNGIDEAVAVFGTFDDGRLGVANARATSSEFRVGALTFVDSVARGDIAAGAGVITDYYIPALGGLSGGDAVVGASLSLTGVFGGENNFVYVDVTVDDAFAFYMIIIHSGGSTFTTIGRPDADGDGLPDEELIGPWPGASEILFSLPAHDDLDTVGTLAMRIWTQSLTDGLNSNSAGFLGTATFSAEPPPGGFVGLATGMAFLPDDAVEASEPVSLALLVFGLVGLAAVRRRGPTS